jgi:hypothetical protein
MLFAVLKGVFGKGQGVCAIGGISLLATAVPATAAAPVVDSFTASSTAVLPGGTVTLTVEAHDPDCAGTCTSGCGLYIRSDVSTWSATGGTFVSTDMGTSGSPYAAAAEWQAVSPARPIWTSR